MTERVQTELAMLRAWWPGLEFEEAGLWVLLAGYRFAPGVWHVDAGDLALQIPAQLPGQAPYGFYVRPGLTLADGRAPTNYAFPSVEPPFGEAPWGKFSWSPVEWRAAADPKAGDNMVGFANSIAERLRDPN